MNDPISDSLLSSEINYLNIAIGIVLCAAVTVTVIFTPILFKKIRSVFPITVNCWFCNKNTKVPYEEANCWDCPFCEQYNGFNKDGSYNKEIKEQHSPSFNGKVFNSTAHGKVEGVKPSLLTNGLCRLCNINQELKIQQLARFVPLDESNYDYEVEEFRQQLENSYRLCSKCNVVLKETLQNQQYNLLKDRLNIQKEKNTFLKLNSMNKWKNHKHILILLRSVLPLCLKYISGIISCMVFLSFLSQLETDQVILKSVADISFLGCQPVLQEFLKSLTYSYALRKELTSVGLLCYGLSSFFRRVPYEHPSLLLFWGILYALSWTDMTGLQVMVSGVCVILSIVEMQQSHNFSLKKLTSYKSEKPESKETAKVKSNFCNMSDDESLPMDQGKCTMKKKIQKKKVRELGETSELLRESGPPELVQETSVTAPEKNLTNNFQNSKTTENQSLNANSVPIQNNNFNTGLGGDRIEKELSPAPELFHNLNNLRISNKLCKPDKPCNFLFENHNFEERCKKNSSIIKSAKFVKSAMNSWTNGEQNETVSRSSTPSSGYSSQKMDKADRLDRRGSFNFPKTVSPVPFIRTTPPETFDYWDKPNTYYGADNFHYFSPGYLPFQPFTNPMGHTAVYAYARPASYPFPIPPPVSQNYGHTPSPQATRYSDISETEHLFQSARKSFQLCQRWSKVKSVLYYVSIFFNVISTCILAYFTWSGVISLTGK